MRTRTNKPSKPLKVHAFKDCTGFDYSDPRDVRFTVNVEDITCGACKQRIVRVLAAADWRHLNLLQVAFVSALKNSVVINEDAARATDAAIGAAMKVERETR